MDEPISRNSTNQTNSKSSNSPSTNNKIESTEIDKLRKELFLTKNENLTLQKKLSDSVNIEAANKEKIADLTNKLKGIEKKYEEIKMKNMATESELEDYVALGRKITLLENENKTLGEKIQQNENNQNDACKIEKRGDSADSIFTHKREEEFQNVMHDYEEFIRKLIRERQVLIDEKITIQNHLSNLEMAFNDLLSKYERSKKFIECYQTNEKALKTQMEEYETVLSNFAQKYNDLKTYAEKKIAEANSLIISKGKENIEEVAKLKAKILQSQVKISELEKHINPKDLKTESLFAPLRNNLKKKPIRNVPM